MAMTGRLATGLALLKVILKEKKLQAVAERPIPTDLITVGEDGTLVSR